MRTSRRNTLLQVTGFSQAFIPTSYLGASLFPRRVLCHYFKKLVDRICDRITGWIRNMISMGGRITLVNSVLNSMAIHILARLPTPSTILNSINSFLTNFVWDSGGQHRRHWVNWGDICKLQHAGDLGIRHLTDIHRNRQYKLAWRSLCLDSFRGRFTHSIYKESQNGSIFGLRFARSSPILNINASGGSGVGISRWRTCSGYINPPRPIPYVTLPCMQSSGTKIGKTLCSLFFQLMAIMTSIIYLSPPSLIGWNGSGLPRVRSLLESFKPC
ncbi:hypothetical protein QQ045_014163 [Rhodiola kirilowii]